MNYNLAYIFTTKLKVLLVLFIAINCVLGQTKKQLGFTDSGIQYSDSIEYLKRIQFKEFESKNKSTRIEDAFNFETRVMGDFAGNIHGGLATGYTYIGIESFTLKFNTNKANLWKGGLFFAHGLNLHGKGPTNRFTNDLQVFSNIEASDFTGLYQIWYVQQFNNLSFLVGQHDLNTEFVGTEYGVNFINSSFGIIPTISHNVPVSIYPVAAPCIIFKYEPVKNLIFKYGCYDGNPGDFNNNRFNLQWNINTNEGFLNISELEYSLINHWQGNIRTQKGLKTFTYKIGFFYHSGSMPLATDSIKLATGKFGLYAIADHMILPKPSNPNEGLALMLQLGFSPNKFDFTSHYIGAGIRYHGIMPYRDHDFIGLAIANVNIGDEYVKYNSTSLNYETAIEFSYKFQFGKHYSLQPDLQYIINPGATKGINNAIGAILRFSIIN